MNPAQEAINMYGPRATIVILVWLIPFLFDKSLEPRRYRIYKYTNVDKSTYLYMKYSRFGLWWFRVKHCCPGYDGGYYETAKFESIDACVKHITDRISELAAIRAQPKPVRVGYVKFNLGRGTTTESKLTVDGVEVPVNPQEGDLK